MGLLSPLLSLILFARESNGFDLTTNQESLEKGLPENSWENIKCHLLSCVAGAINSLHFILHVGSWKIALTVPPESFQSEERGRWLLIGAGLSGKTILSGREQSEQSENRKGINAIENGLGKLLFNL